MSHSFRIADAQLSVFNKCYRTIVEERGSKSYLLLFYTRESIQIFLFEER